VSIKPFVLRLVCENGAIMADSGDALEIDLRSSEEPEREFKEAFAVCASEQVFLANSDLMHRSIGRQQDFALTYLAVSESLRGFGLDRRVDRILDELLYEGDYTVFGLMNAVTAVARDTLNPEEKWRMEELGGGVPLLAYAHVRIGRDAKDLSDEFVFADEWVEQEEALQLT
jgi:hypothetical protein